MTMTSEEFSMLHTYLHKSQHYLEFGSGVSTLHASCVPKIKTIDSVESSEGFADNLIKRYSAIQTALSMEKLKFKIIDIGETGNFGFPLNESKKNLWPNYSKSIFLDKSNHDLVLIDGRFRVACTLQCILNTPNDCTILIHDFWNRPEYHILLKFLHPLERVDTFGVFNKKDQTLDMDEINMLIYQYQYLPGDKVPV